MTDLAAQFLADAGSAPASAPAASAPAATGLAAQFLADASSTPAPAAPAPSAPPSAASQVGRQVGLTARAGVTGLTALPAMVGDALNAGVNLGIRGINDVAGTHIPQLALVSGVIQRAETAAGLPVPKNATERVVQDATGAMAGVAPSVGIGKLLVGAASPIAQAVGSGLQAIPGAQIAGAAGAGAGSGMARELGLGPGYQIGAALLGGAAGVGAGSLATAGARAVGNRIMPAPTIPAAAAASRAETAVDQVLGDLGPAARQSYEPAPQAAAPGAPQTTAAPVPGGQFGAFQPIRERVAQAIQENPQVDPAAVMRAQDFQTLGMQPTLGQITRDPMQFAQEMNMRGTSTGAPLANRFNQQNAQLQQALAGLTGTPADAYQAGNAIKASLKSIDDQMGQQVSDAYAAARASSGKNLDVPLAGVAQDYAQVLNDFGDKVPSGVRTNFEQLGLMGGAQRKTFTIENAENLLKVINANQSNDPATNAALGQLRSSVKNAILSADDQGGVYAPARALAAQRFALQDQIPALKAAASDNVAADDFVRRFVVGGKTDEVSAMAQLLQQHAPDAFTEMRQQIGAQLAAKGFGANPAGDARFNPSPYMQQMRAFGPTKLAAFYTPDELAQLNAIGRVGAYMNSFPAAAPVNTSNTASAIGSMMANGAKGIPGMAWVGRMIDNAQNRAFVNKALAARLSDAAVEQAGSAPAQRALGSLLLNSAQRTPSGHP